MGLGLTAGFYGASVGASLLSPDAPGADQLLIPIAGPWLALAETGCREGESDCPLFPVIFRAVLTAIDGVAQAGGLGIALESLWLPTAKGETPPTETATRATSFKVRPVPWLAPTSVGVGLMGRF